MKTFFDSIRDGAKSFFVSQQKKMTPNELKDHFQECVGTLSFELKKEAKAVESAEKKAAELKFKAVEAANERDRKFILQQYVAENAKARDAKNRAEGYIRRITVYEKNLSILSLSESLTNALGEEVPFDDLMRELSGMEGEFEKLNVMLKEMEEQTDMLDKQFAESDDETAGASESIEELSSLIEKMKNETDPVRKADLEREYNAAMEKLAEPVAEG